MRAFFYGTLMDEEVLALVLARDLDDGALHRATLSGYRRVALKGRMYPAIIRDPRSAVDGIVAEGLDDRDLDRLIVFEGEEYDLARSAVRIEGGREVDAMYFVAGAVARPQPAPWSYDTWRRRHRTAYLRRLRTGAF